MEFLPSVQCSARGMRGIDIVSSDQVGKLEWLSGTTNGGISTVILAVLLGHPGVGGCLWWALDE